MLFIETFRDLFVKTVYAKALIVYAVISTLIQGNGYFEVRKHVQINCFIFSGTTFFSSTSFFVRNM